MSVINERAWTKEQLDTLYNLSEQIRHSADRVQIWEADGGFPGLVPADGLPSGSVSWDDIAGKPDTFPPSEHTHNWSEITGKPDTFPPSDHTHDASDITGLGSSTIYPGWIKSTGGSSQLPTGWSVSRLSAGRYKVTHDLGLASKYDLSVIAVSYWEDVGIDIRTCSVIAATINDFTVEASDTADTARDTDIFFLASTNV